MQRRSRTRWALLWCLAGCARGAASLAANADPGAAGPGDASTQAVEGSDAAQGAEQPDASVEPGLGPDGSGAPADDSDAGSPERGADAGSDDAGATPSCDAPNMCPSARALSAVAGDTGSDVSMANGTRSEWLSVLVSDTTLTGSELAARLTLTSSGGANYDLFVLKPSDSGGNTNAPKDCAATPDSSRNATGTDTVSLAWDDETNNFGESAGDGLVLSIEVRHVSGPCGSYTLAVQGNP